MFNLSSVKKKVTFLIGAITLTSFWEKEIPAVIEQNSKKDIFFIIFGLKDKLKMRLHLIFHKVHSFNSIVN